MGRIGILPANAEILIVASVNAKASHPILNNANKEDLIS